jgi:hypothetical protein
LKTHPKPSNYPHYSNRFLAFRIQGWLSQRKIRDAQNARLPSDLASSMGSMMAGAEVALWGYSEKLDKSPKWSRKRGRRR